MGISGFWPALAAAVLGLAGLQGHAAAAPPPTANGCANFSGSFFRTLSGGVFSGNSAASGFRQGDVILVSDSQSFGHITLYADGTKVADASKHLFYVVPNDTAATFSFVTSGNPFLIGQGITWSCVAIQKNGSQTEATNSLSAINGMLDTVIDGTLDGAFQPIVGGTQGIGVMVAPGQKIEPVADAPVALESESPYRMFIQGRYTAANGDATGSQFNGIFGASYRLAQTTALGAFGGFESFNFTDPSNSTFGGSGESLGVFAATRVDRLSLDARAYATFLDYQIEVGGKPGNTTATRLAGSLTAAYEFASGATSFRPYIKATGLSENQVAYVDVSSIAHPAFSYAEGIAAAGVRVSHTSGLANGGSMTPYVSGEADYVFGSTAIAGFSNSSGVSGKLNAGLTLALRSGATFGLDAGYAGIGTTIQSWSAEASVSLPF